MTAIVGYTDGKTVWIGGDSGAQTGGWQKLVIKEQKVWKNKDILFGGAGRWCVLQALQASLELSHRPDNISDIDYLVKYLTNDIKQILKLYDLTMISDESSTGIVIGYRGNLYHLDSYFNLNAFHAPILCDGNGGDLAKGALQAYLTNHIEPESAIIKALQIAGEYNLTVAPPYYVLSV